MQVFVVGEHSILEGFYCVIGALDEWFVGQVIFSVPQWRRKGVTISSSTWSMNPTI